MEYPVDQTFSSVLIESFKYAVLAAPFMIGLSSAIAYPIFRMSAVRDVSKSLGVDSSELDKGNATRLWLSLYQPHLLFLPEKMPSPELEVMVGVFSELISGVEDERIRHLALDHLVQIPTVKEYVIKQ